ncbi:MAG: transporter substrate-binding domain-containing protein [Beijerinckiaceae bacterium]
MKILKLALATATAIGLALTATAALAQQRKVKVATEGAYAPWNFVNAQGKLEGFEIDLIADLCKRASLDCEVVAQDWDGIIPSLLAKKYDVIMAGMNITAKRQETVSFTRAYAAGPHGVMALKGTKFPAAMPTGTFNLTKQKGEADKAIEGLKAALKGKVVGVQVSTTNANFVNEFLKGVAEVREYKSTEQHDLDLAAGRIDVAFAAHSAFVATIASPGGKDMEIVGPALSGGILGDGVAGAFRKEDNDLRAAFDKAIGEALADGSVKKLTEKWFKLDMSPTS